MKKSIIIGMLGISMLGLTACGSNSAKSNTASSQSSKKVESKFANIANGKDKVTAINTDKGTLKLYKGYSGISYNSDNKPNMLAMIISYKVTNNTKKPLTASQIANGTEIHLIEKHDNKLQDTDQPLGIETVYKDDNNSNIDKINKLQKAEQDWDSSQIEPGKTAIVAAPNGLAIGNTKPSENYFRLVTTEVNTDSSFIDKNKNQMNMNQMNMEYNKPVKDPVDILK